MTTRKTSTVISAGVGAIAGAAVSGLGVLAAQAVQARRRIGPRTSVPPYHDGRYGTGHGTSIRIAMLGDSGAAGLGADGPDSTMGAVIAKTVTDVAHRPVILINHAVVGAQTKDLDAQVDRALTAPPHLAIIMIGANDVTHLVPATLSGRRLGRVIRRLKEHDIGVVIASCPDLGTIKPVPQPLRNIMGRASKRMADEQHKVARENGAIPVALGTILGPEFDQRPHFYFADDQFHPSADGYFAAAQVLLPSVLQLLDLIPERKALPAREQA